MDLFSNSLADLAARIKAEHGACAAALHSSLQHALAAGDLLIEAKAQLRHGEWLPWLNENCAVSERMARLYMRLAANRETIEAKSATGVADLSIRGAIALIATPRNSIPPGFKNTIVDAIETDLDMNAFEKWQVDRLARRMIFEETEAVLEKIGAFADVPDPPAAVYKMFEQFSDACNECKKQLDAAIATKMPYHPCQTATVAVAKARDIAVDILTTLEAA
jgi:hypothetical protein